MGFPRTKRSQGSRQRQALYTRDSAGCGANRNAPRSGLLPLSSPRCGPRRFPLPLSPHQRLRTILPFSPSTAPPACVRCSGRGHRDGPGRSPLLLFLSSDNEARETLGSICYRGGQDPLPWQRRAAASSIRAPLTAARSGRAQAQTAAWDTCSARRAPFRVLAEYPLGCGFQGDDRGLGASSPGVSSVSRKCRRSVSSLGCKFSHVYLSLASFRTCGNIYKYVSVYYFLRC